MSKYFSVLKEVVEAIPAWHIGADIYPKDGVVPRSMNREGMVLCLFDIMPINNFKRYDSATHIWK